MSKNTSKTNDCGKTFHMFEIHSMSMNIVTKCKWIRVCKNAMVV